MKNKHPKVFLTTLLLLLCTVATAQDFEVDGIYYNILSKEEKTVEVTSGATKYTGSVVIPETVTISETGTTVLKTFDAWTSTNKNQHNTTSQTSYTLNVEAGNILNFNWSVSSESNYDWLTITLDGTQIVRKSGITSGSYEKTFTTAGTHTLVVKYTKDSSGNNGDDEGRIFNITLNAEVDNEVVYSVTAIGTYAFRDCSNLTSIEIPNSVTTIGNYAFRDCSSLTSITIPNSVTYIGEDAFAYCSSLTSISVAAGNTTYDSRDNCNAIIETATNKLISGCQNTVIPNSVTTIGSSAFSGCSSLTSIEIPNSVTTIGSDAFRDCNGLTSIEIPNSVTTIGSDAFRDCNGLTSIEIPNSITTIGNYAFYGCTCLTNAIIGNNLTKIGTEAFYGCTALNNIINLSNLNLTKGSAGYGYIGYYAQKITNAPNGTIEGDYIFSTVDGKHTLVDYLRNTNIKIVDSWTLQGESGFPDKTVTTTFNANAGDILTFDYYIYGNNQNGLYIYIDNKKIFYMVGSSSSGSYNSRDGYQEYTIENNGEHILEVRLYNKNNDISHGTISNVYLEKKDTDIPSEIILPENFKGSSYSIGNYVFYGCRNLQEFTIPNSVTNIGSYAFRNCTNLNSITIPDNVKNIGLSAFSNCTSLSSITIGSGVEKIDNKCFNNCKSVKSLYINTSVKIYRTKS